MRNDENTGLMLYFHRFLSGGNACFVAIGATKSVASQKHIYICQRFRKERTLIEDNAAALMQLWLRLLFEDTRLPKKADAVYLHGLSEGMVASCGLFELIADFIFSGRTNYIAFNGSDGRGMPPQDRAGAAWPGANWYRQELALRGVSSEMLIGDRGGLHTRDECDAFVELAKERGWRTVIDVTVPYHWPRVLSCFVGAMARLDYFISVHFARPKFIRWHLPMAGSQGIEKGSTFFKEAGADVLRLFKYWDKGREGDSWRSAWGAPPEEILQYLDRRDAKFFSVA